MSCIVENDGYEPASVWPCYTCRQTPSRLANIENFMSTILARTDEMKALFIDSIREKDTIINELRGKLTEADTKDTVIKELRGRLAETESKLSAQHWQGFRADDSTKVISTSMMRNVDASKLVNTKITCISGGLIQGLTAETQKLPATKSVGHLMLVGGGNDCDRPQADAAAIVEDFKGLIRSGKEVAQKITVSSILPRQGRAPAVNDTIDSVNAELVALCQDEKVELIDHREAKTGFYLPNGQVNDGYFVARDIHPNKPGTNALVSALALPLRQGVTSAFYDPRLSNKPPPVPPAPTEPAAEIDLTQTFWKQAAKKVNASEKRPPYKQHVKQNPPAPETYRPRFQPPRPSRNVTPLMNVNAPPPSPRTNTPRSSHVDAPNDSTPCQLCGLFGHTARTCNSKTSDCYNCGQIGHLARVCRR